LLFESLRRRVRDFDSLKSRRGERCLVIFGAVQIYQRAQIGIRGAALRGIEYELPVASAQVKSCVLLAALAADGATTVTEPEVSRDHTERMLAAAGVDVRREGRHITVRGVDELALDELVVPGDPSSAAFPVATRRARARHRCPGRAQIRQAVRC